MADDGPPLLRPIPRRPFALALGLKPPTPPRDDDDSDDDDDDDEMQREEDLLLAQFRRELSSFGLLGLHCSPPDLSAPITRPQSYMNLTSSTLAGIYEPTASGQDDNDRDQLNTPWGTGAETPVKKRPGIDEATYELMRDRSRIPRRRLSYTTAETAAIRAPSSAIGTASFLVPRTALLFLLGVGYGVLVTRLHNEQGLGPLASYDGTYLVFWGLSGVVLGALQPWFDKVWEEMFGPESGEAEDEGDAGLSDKHLGPRTDWALVMRAVGAFVGIVFAIRKLAWTSTMQLSATLALVNPLLWWLIDRSKPGFVLSAGVGLAGSTLLLGVNPEMMPAPSGPVVRNSSSEGHVPLTLGGLASQEMVEAGVWMLSVLFCSCLCFGNIGRRLAWSKSAVSRGRWGGVR